MKPTMASTRNHLVFNEVMKKTSPLVVNCMGIEADPQTTNGEVCSLIILAVFLKASIVFGEFLSMV